uniref:Uncharacterized protein n=1 Tax=viral metagenome TaxID=1070528 RepID=A0A6C0I9K4_9ZZZZ
MTRRSKAFFVFVFFRQPGGAPTFGWSDHKPGCIFSWASAERESVDGPLQKTCLHTLPLTV